MTKENRRFDPSEFEAKLEKNDIISARLSIVDGGFAIAVSDNPMARAYLVSESGEEVNKLYSKATTEIGRIMSDFLFEFKCLAMKKKNENDGQDCDIESGSGHDLKN